MVISYLFIAAKRHMINNFESSRELKLGENLNPFGNT